MDLRALVAKCKQLRNRVEGECRTMLSSPMERLALLEDVGQCLREVLAALAARASEEPQGWPVEAGVCDYCKESKARTTILGRNRICDDCFYAQREAPETPEQQIGQAVMEALASGDEWREVSPSASAPPAAQEPEK